jgi:hypothetical protein
MPCSVGPAASPAPELSLQLILGTLLRPLAWLMGIPWQESTYAGGLIGLKATLNEFVAYGQFSADVRNGMPVSPRTAIILTYALLASPTSPPSPSRSAASADSRRSGGARLRAMGSGRWWRGTWRRSPRRRFAGVLT